MLMRWCNVQTSGYDPRAVTHPTICTHHRLLISNGYKISASLDPFEATYRIWRYNLQGRTAMERYDNNGKC